MKGLSRRDLLGLFAATATPFALRSPVDSLIDAIGHSWISRALAEGTAQSRTRKYITVSGFGAPNRSMFDQVLKPSANAAFIAAPHLGTRLLAGTPITGIESFETTMVDVGGTSLLLPYMWKFPVAAPGGKTRPLTDLLPHMLTIRGIDVGIDGHIPANIKWERPSASAPSFLGVTHDSGTSPLGSIVIGESAPVEAGFSARSGSSPTTFRAAQAQTALLRPFVSDASETFRAKKDGAEAAINRALDRLRFATRSSEGNYDALFRDIGNAKTLIKRGVDGFGAAYPPLVQKYQDLLDRSMKPSLTSAIPGLTSQLPVPVATSDKYRFHDVIRNELIIIADEDFSQCFNQMLIPMLAEQFAIAEYTLMNDLCDGCAIGITNPQIRARKYVSHAGSSREILTEDHTVAINLDGHGMGSAITVVAMSLLWRGVSACLLELMDTLKSKKIGNASLFEESVISLVTDFGRAANVEGDGSEHGFNGASVTLLSGAIKSPIFVGNIYDRPSVSLRSRWDNTWGYAAPIPAWGRPLNVGNYASTLAGLLRVPSPTTNDPAVAVEQGSGVTLVSEMSGQFLNVENE